MGELKGVTFQTHTHYDFVVTWSSRIKEELFHWWHVTSSPVWMIEQSHRTIARALTVWQIAENVVTLGPLAREWRSVVEGAFVFCSSRIHTANTQQTECLFNIVHVVFYKRTSSNVLLSWKICPSPSTCRTHSLQLISVVAGLSLSRVKVQWRVLWLPLHTW